MSSEQPPVTATMTVETRSCVYVSPEDTEAMLLKQFGPREKPKKPHVTVGRFRHVGLYTS